MSETVQHSLLQRWERQVEPRLQSEQWRRLIGAFACLHRQPAIDGLIPLSAATLVVLFDEPDERRAIHFAGFWASRVPWGVCWGGRDANRFAKDLALRPSFGAMGRRLELARPNLLKIALDLDRLLERRLHSAFCSIYRRPQLPNLWAAFDPARTPWVSGQGVEIERVCQRTGRSVQTLMVANRRVHDGRVLFPLPWVSHHWPEIVDVYVDVALFPKRQVFSTKGLPACLKGFKGAAEFDFFSDRFSAPPQRLLPNGRPERRLTFA